MKPIHMLAVAALTASSSAFAIDVDFQPYGYVSAVIQDAQADRQRGAAAHEKSRAQIRAETREAARLGLLSNSEAGGEQPTPEQAHQIEQAGLRAIVVDAASK